MKEKLTNIHIPGVCDSGLANRGEHSAAEMIADYRRYAEHMKASAEVVLATPDADFRVYVARGVHAEDLIRELQPGRATGEKV